MVSHTIVWVPTWVQHAQHTAIISIGRHPLSEPNQNQIQKRNNSLFFSYICFHNQNKKKMDNWLHCFSDSRFCTQLENGQKVWRVIVQFAYFDLSQVLWLGSFLHSTVENLFDLIILWADVFHSKSVGLSAVIRTNQSSDHVTNTNLPQACQQFMQLLHFLMTNDTNFLCGHISWCQHHPLTLSEKHIRVHLCDGGCYLSHT